MRAPSPPTRERLVSTTGRERAEYTGGGGGRAPKIINTTPAGPEESQPHKAGPRCARETPSRAYRQCKEDAGPQKSMRRDVAYRHRHVQGRRSHAARGRPPKMQNHVSAREPKLRGGGGGRPASLQAAGPQRNNAAAQRSKQSKVCHKASGGGGGRGKQMLRAPSSHGRQM